MNAWQSVPGVQMVGTAGRRLLSVLCFYFSFEVISFYSIFHIICFLKTGGSLSSRREEDKRRQKQVLLLGSQQAICTYDVNLVLRPESFRVLLSCANQGFIVLLFKVVKRVTKNVQLVLKHCCKRVEQRCPAFFHAVQEIKLKGFNSWVVKRATSLLFTNSFSSNVAKQVARFFFTVLLYL